MAFNITKLIISLLIFSSAIILFAGAYGNIISNYSPSYPVEEERFYVFNDSYERVNRYMTEVQNHTTGAAQKSLTDLSKYYDAIMAFVSVGKVFSEMPNIFTDYINMFQMTDEGSYMLGFEIPSIIVSLVLTILMVIIIMNIAKIFLKRDEI